MSVTFVFDIVILHFHSVCRGVRGRRSRTGDKVGWEALKGKGDSLPYPRKLSLRIKS